MFSEICVMPTAHMCSVLGSEQRKTETEILDMRNCGHFIPDECILRKNYHSKCYNILEMIRSKVHGKIFVSIVSAYK
jgi:hypothetical protein